MDCSLVPRPLFLFCGSHSVKNTEEEEQLFRFLVLYCMNGMHFVHSTFEYGSDYSHCDIQYTKLVELEAVSQVKKLMIYGSQCGPGQYTGGGTSIINKHMVDNAASGNCSDINVSR